MKWCTARDRCWAGCPGLMGGEFAQSGEWEANGELDWWLVEAGPYHRGAQRFVQDLNRFYLAEPGLWQSDFDTSGFSWIDCSDHEGSVLSFARQDADRVSESVVILNLTPVPRHGYRIGLPRPGKWREKSHKRAPALWP